jgi:hypothetical protein
MDKNKSAVSLGKLASESKTQEERAAHGRAGGNATRKNHTKAERSAIALKGHETRKKKEEGK